MKLLAKPKTLAFLVSPMVSAIVFYVLVVLRLQGGDYLPGIRIFFFLVAIPFSYIGVLIFGLPSLALLKKLQLNSYYSWAVLGFISGVLTILLLISIILIVQKAGFKEAYGDMLEPILFAGIAGLLGILVFKYISEKGAK